MGQQSQGTYIQGLSDGTKWVVEDLGIYPQYSTTKPYSFVLTGTQSAATTKFYPNTNVQDPFTPIVPTTGRHLLYT